MYRSSVTLLEDVFDTLAGNTEFVTPQGFRCNVSEMEINYDSNEITIDGQYVLSIKKKNVKTEA